LQSESDVCPAQYHRIVNPFGNASGRS
jgi:hypothetical protein